MQVLSKVPTKLCLDRNTTEDEKDRGLPEITKLRRTSTILRATYREVWLLTNPLKIHLP